MTTDPCPISYDVVLPKLTSQNGGLDYPLLGAVVFYPHLKGWLFISQVQGHGNGRKPRTHPHLAVPRWALLRGAKLV